MKKVLWTIVAAVAMVAVMSSCKKDDTTSEAAKFVGDYNLKFEKVEVIPGFDVSTIVGNILPEGDMSITEALTNYIGVLGEGVYFNFKYGSAKVPLLTAKVSGNSLTFSKTNLSSLSNNVSALVPGLDGILQNDTADGDIIVTGTGELLSDGNVQMVLYVDGLKVTEVALPTVTITGLATRK